MSDKQQYRLMSFLFFTCSICSVDGASHATTNVSQSRPRPTDKIQKNTISISLVKEVCISLQVCRKLFQAARFHAHTEAITNHTVQFKGHDVCVCLCVYVILCVLCVVCCVVTCVCVVWCVVWCVLCVVCCVVVVVVVVCIVVLCACCVSPHVHSLHRV